MSIKASTCPCGSGQSYLHCCQPYLTGAQAAPTAQALMRSRYTAYTLGEVDYIVNTHHPDTRDSLDVEATRAWAAESEWRGLEIIASQGGETGDTQGGVEFIARFSQDGVEYEHHEQSRFEKLDGSWYFVEGTLVPKTVVNTGPQVGRNDPCPCGSGKKFKKCCGR